MKKVFIGVGHGGRDGGAAANGLLEKNVNLVMALSMKAELERHGVEVGISRTTDVDDTLTQEISKCNAFAPDVAVECHNNAGGGKGFEAFRQTNAFGPRSLALGNAIEAQVKAIGQNSRGIKTRLNGSMDYYGWCRQVNCPALLCEGAFLDHSEDYLMINTETKQKAFGVAYAKGVLEYLGIAWNAPGATLYGVARQVIALTNREDAQRYASAMNAEDKDAYYKVIEIAQ